VDQESNRLKIALRMIKLWLKGPYIGIHECEDCGKKFLTFSRDDAFCNLDCESSWHWADWAEEDEQEPPSLMQVPRGF
jgi:hypothetical protein